MNSAYQVPDQIYRTRQIALLLGDADRATALAYAAELESTTTPSAPSGARSRSAIADARR